MRTDSDCAGMPAAGMIGRLRLTEMSCSAFSGQAICG
jgi:hypothetical protein